MLVSDCQWKQTKLIQVCMCVILTSGISSSSSDSSIFVSSSPSWVMLLMWTSMALAADRFAVFFDLPVPWKKFTVIRPKNLIFNFSDKKLLNTAYIAVCSRRYKTQNVCCIFYCLSIKCISKQIALNIFPAHDMNTVDNLIFQDKSKFISRSSRTFLCEFAQLDCTHKLPIVWGTLLIPKLIDGGLDQFLLGELL